jgi:signal transduction histidine kinase
MFRDGFCRGPRYRPLALGAGTDGILLRGTARCGRPPVGVYLSAEGSLRMGTSCETQRQKPAQSYDLMEQLIVRTEQLLAAREEVRTLERMKRNFVTLMAHELRTPLTSIVGMSELILADLYEDPADLDAMIRTVYNEGTKLTSIRGRGSRASRFAG